MTIIKINIERAHSRARERRQARGRQSEIQPVSLFREQYYCATARRIAAKKGKVPIGPLPINATTDSAPLRVPARNNRLTKR